MHLNPEQLAAVHYIEGPLLVLAGAGSGKTGVITRKIAWLIQHCGHAAQAISAVTFTNKAAHEMQERVAKLLPAHQIKGLHISTFHTLGLRILKADAKVLGFKAGFSIYDAEDALKLVTELIDDNTLDPKLYYQHIANWKNANTSAQQALAQAINPFEVAVADIYARYQRQLKIYNAVDFDDLISLPLHLLSEYPDILEKWQNRIRYLLVDEYQDTNITQYQLVRLLAGVRAAFTVVGDDDQSIYAWRGARPENLQHLAQDYPALRIIKLEQNYRSTARILRAANQVIACNQHIFDKRLWSEHGEGEVINGLICKSADDEAAQVAFAIRTHHHQYKTAFADYAILYRGNHQARLFELALRQQHVPYRVTGGMSFFQQAEIRDVMAYLRVITNPDDNAALLRVINVPRREIGATTLEKLGLWANEHHLSLFSALTHPQLKTFLGERFSARLQRVAGLFFDWQHRALTASSAELTQQIVSEIKYIDWLKTQTQDSKAIERRMRNIDELANWLGDGLLLQRLNAVNLAAILDNQAQAADDTDAVTLMTLHTAKGLEFPFVYLVGLEEDLLPHKNSIDMQFIEEERRLFYVGITRARQELSLTYCKQRKRYGVWESCKPSRFLAEIAVEDVVWHGAHLSLTPEQKQHRGRAALDAIRASLKQ